MKKLEWNWVPLQPTREMLAAGEAVWTNDRLRRSTTLFPAMMAAAPASKGGADPGRFAPSLPTRAMLAAGQKAWLKDRSLSTLYRAMVEAAPAVPEQALEGALPLSLKVVGHECSVLMPREQYIALRDDIGFDAVEAAMTAAGAVARSVSYVPLEPCEVQFEIEAGKDPKAVGAAIAGLLAEAGPQAAKATKKGPSL